MKNHKTSLVTNIVITIIGLLGSIITIYVFFSDSSSPEYKKRSSKKEHIAVYSEEKNKKSGLSTLIIYRTTGISDAKAHRV